MFHDSTTIYVLNLQGVIDSKYGHNDKKITVDTVKNLVSKTPKNTEIMVVRLSSPGGSPHASYTISTYLRNYCDENNIKLITYVEDCAASGGYYIASSSDKIVCNKYSILGSIGVISGMPDFTEIMERYGIGYRTFTVGKHKASPTPFTKMTEAQEKFIKDIMQYIYNNFVDDIKNNRGLKLRFDLEPEEEMFSGKVYMAEEAIKFGLADECYENFDEFLEDISDNHKVVYSKVKKPLFSFLPNFISGSISNAIKSTIDEILTTQYNFK